MRFAVDTGGTFTDLVVEEGDGTLEMFKAPTTPDDPVEGILEVLNIAAETRGVTRRRLLEGGSTFLHGTTRAINAILTGTTGRTALLTTAGHPDVLLFREGGRENVFDWRDYPDPYVPRALTFQIPERVDSTGNVQKPLDENTVVEICGELRRRSIEAVAVCLLWSVVNPAHELRVGEILRERLPAVPFTLSHALNPVIREYRRASAAAIDASLKPLMTSYLQGLEARLREAGFSGRVLVVTSAGGLIDAADSAQTPIHTVNSGPAMAPVAGRHFAALDLDATTAIVADTGGTSYDVSLVRRGSIPSTRETWIGQRFLGYMTGFPSVDVKSIGAGGGSIAWIDDGGLLHVGPRSAGAVPGPVAYDRGGTEPTVTDAALTLGYLDPTFFLGGRMELAREAAHRAIEQKVAQPLGLSVSEAAAAILLIATELMVGAIEDITVDQGVDPRGAVLVAGGGAAGLNAVAVARRLGCGEIIVPEVAAALSATGALLSDLTADYGSTFLTSTSDFDYDGANLVLQQLKDRCNAFAARAGGETDGVIEVTAEARYAHQIWEIDVPLTLPRFGGSRDVAKFRDRFHEAHAERFAVRDPDSPVEITHLRAQVRCGLGSNQSRRVKRPKVAAELGRRRVYFREAGEIDVPVWRFEGLAEDAVVTGPAIVESSFTTVVIDPEASGWRSKNGSLILLSGARATKEEDEAASPAGVTGGDIE